MVRALVVRRRTGIHPGIRFGRRAGAGFRRRVLRIGRGLVGGCGIFRLAKPGGVVGPDGGNVPASASCVASGDDRAAGRIDRRLCMLGRLWLEGGTSRR